MGVELEGWTEFEKRLLNSDDILLGTSGIGEENQLAAPISPDGLLMPGGPSIEDWSVSMVSYIHWGKCNRITYLSVQKRGDSRLAVLSERGIRIRDRSLLLPSVRRCTSGDSGNGSVAAVHVHRRCRRRCHSWNYLSSSSSCALLLHRLFGVVVISPLISPSPVHIHDGSLELLRLRSVAQIKLSLVALVVIFDLQL